MKPKSKEEVLHNYLKYREDEQLEPSDDITVAEALGAMDEHAQQFRPSDALAQIKAQFDERKRLHLEASQYQPALIDSKWSAKATASLIDILYLTVEEILSLSAPDNTTEKENDHTIENHICYHGGFERATEYIDCEKTDCKTCICNQETK